MLLSVSAVLVLAGTAEAGSAERSSIKTAAAASDRGEARLAAGFDVGVVHPSQMFLRIHTNPAIRLRVEYQYTCRSRGRSRSRHAVIRRGPGYRSLPLPFQHTKSCAVFNFNSYPNNRRVQAAFRVVLRVSHE